MRRFCDPLVALVASEPLRIVSVVVDEHTHSKASHRKLTHPYCYGLHALLERYVKFLVASGNAAGDVLTESRGGREDMLLKQEYDRIYSHGTPYAGAATFKKPLTTRELEIKGKHANVAGLQVADLFAYPRRVTRS
ncbi:MAG: DUF3800 domain-containing protein [Bryobacteraceae bacterium]